MKPYGMKRNYNYTDDFQRNAEARRRTTQSKLNKQVRRIGRHKAKNFLRKLFSLRIFED